MRDYKNNPEIEINEYYQIEGENDIKISLVICCYNTAHLLKRSIKSYCNQDFNKNNFEIIFINDSSCDDVREAIEYGIGKINIRYIFLNHDFGMRGNQCAFNTGFAWAQGEILSETTAETIFTPDSIRIMHDTHNGVTNTFCAMKTYNLTPELQIMIDDVDWESDVNLIKTLPNFENDWTLNNVKTTHFGTHQTCSIRKDVFYRLFPDGGFPLYGGYGEEDPRYSGVRERNKINDITIMEPMIFHQWHVPYYFWQMKGKSKYINKFGHSTSNFMNDTSGEVPPSGSACIFDGCSKEWFSDEEIENAKYLDDLIRQTGCEIPF